MSFRHWLVWVAVFMIVVGSLSVAIGVLEWWRFRKEEKRLRAFRKKFRITIRDE